MSLPHVLVLPWPTQGHLNPLMHISHFLSNQGFAITFVNTDFNHDRVMATSAGNGIGMESGPFRMISVPLGITGDEDRKDPRKLTAALEKEMSPCLEKVIEKSNEKGEDRISCLIVDQGMAWGFEFARKMGIRAVAFWPASATVLATILSIPKLIEDGIIDLDGLPKHQEKFQLSPNSPPMDETHLAWNYIGDRSTQQLMFRYFWENTKKTKVDLILCNSFQDLEGPILENFPIVLPIGPLPIDRVSQISKPIGHFWSEDPTYLTWLDQQAPNSVVYIAFGSLASVAWNQLEELALGLEISNRPFLWVIRPDLIENLNASDDFLNQFQERVKGRGKIVQWCNQEKVLAHNSVACFVSHCGWNSTMEGVKNGMNFLCRPCFGDQFVNQEYICDVWKVGLKLTPDESGVVTRECINSMLAELLANGEMKVRAEEMKERANRSICEGGSSFKNLAKFMEIMKK